MTGLFMGTPHYIILVGGDEVLIFARDMSSLGCTLYHFLSGRPRV